jgi:hypothetical protein
MKPGYVWVGVGLLYAAFFGWYTSFGGPLSDREIEGYAEQLSGRVEPEQMEILLAFMRSDTGDDFAMFNAIDYRDEPLPTPGARPGETSAEVMRRYVAPFMGRAIRSAAHPIFIGEAAAPALDRWGADGMGSWDSGGIVRYRSRRDLMDQLLYTLDSDIHVFKRAAIEKTIAYPIDPFFQLGDPRLLLALLLLLLGLSGQLWARGRSGAAR